jgi:two-component system response regulator YesN
MLKAMIVEDNAIYRYAIKSIIRWEDYGFQIVCEALNGVHALDLLQHQHVDLIVTDISMPEMNGIDLIQQVKQKDASIKIVALSSFDDFRFVKEALKLGAEDYLLKHDLEPSALQQLLQQMNAKIVEDQQLRKHTHIRDATFQEMRWMLGRKLLMGELKQAEDIEDQVKAVHFPIHGGPTAIIMIDGNYKLLEHGSSAEQPEHTNMVIPITERRTAVITYFPHEKSERKCMEETLSQASQLYKRMKETGPVTMGISSMGYGLLDWAHLFKQAEAALEQSVYEGAGQIFTYAALIPFETVDSKAGVSIQPLVAAIRGGLYADVVSQTELFYQGLSQRKPPITELKHLLIELTMLLKTIALERNKYSDRFDHDYKQISQAIEVLQPLHQVKQLFLDLNKQIVGNNAENTIIRKEIQGAIAYIDEHYAEDITVTRLAEVLHLSTNYLSNLFKSETGMRIVEYMNRCRIQKAKQLLQDSSMKVYEVAEKTGFQETSYFCKVFKELEGKTVKEFRREG